MNNFLNTPNYFENAFYQNNFPFDFSQNNLYTEFDGGDDKTGLNFQQPNPIIDIKKENDNYGDKLLEVENNLTLQILSKKDDFNKYDQSKFNSNSITKHTTKALGRKTKRNDDYLGEGIETELNNKTKKIKQLKITKNCHTIEINEFKKNGEEKKIQGRKKKEEKDKGNHTKDSEDNIMRKIKSNFLDFSHKLINKSLQDKSWTFLKMKSILNENLKRDYNINLLDKTFKELYEETIISAKYRSPKMDRKDKNKSLIQKIYEENYEIDTIKLLNLTYRELFNVFTRKIKNISPELEMKIEGISLLETDEFSDIYKFFDEVENQERKHEEPEEDIKSYLEKLKNLCMDYENWFLNKKGRNRSANKKMKK